VIGHYSLGGVEAYQELQKHVASEEDAARLVQLATSFGEVRVTYKGGVLAVNIREGYYNIEITEPRKVDTITDRMIRESRKKK
jgi:hypothetical protein